MHYRDDLESNLYQHNFTGEKTNTNRASKKKKKNRGIHRERERENLEQNQISFPQTLK